MCVGVGLLSFGFHEGGLELLVAADWVFVKSVLVFLDIVEILKNIAFIDGEDIGDTFGVYFGRAGSDQKPAIFGIFQLLRTIEHK